ncbi:hypothetical protein NAPIS_ORF02260 [Vairimorpha apis BRL 01]|uniref:Uncharacterized protein n=1 Tax=Vairimorpha apis BRL 01 TaxID=1037528 RepID=T0MGL3_9MICR|nr:hypothetical protein NAPIS_ORF02260 [Vairimorpha apis BRL 01]
MYGLNYFSILIITIIFASNTINDNYECLNLSYLNYTNGQSKTNVIEDTITNYDLIKVNKNTESGLNFNIKNNYRLIYERYYNVLDKNKIEVINYGRNINVNKRKLDEFEPLDLSTKCMRLENIPNTHNVVTNYSHIQEKYLNYVNFTIDNNNLIKLVSLDSFLYVFKIIENDLINSLKVL